MIPRIRSSALAWAIPLVLATLLIGGPLVQVRAQAAVSSSERTTLKAINAYFNAIRTMQGDFVQFGPDGTRTEGRFYIARPGKIRFRYAKPARLDIIADGKSVAVRDRRLATQDIWPLKRTPLRFLVAESLDLQKDAKIRNITVEPDLVTIVIDENTVFGDGRLTLMFDAKTHQLRQWTVKDAQGYDTSVAIYNVETGKPTNPKWFFIDYTIIR